MLPFSMLTALLFPLLVTPVLAFIGLGIDMYNPSCAYACRSVIASAMLDCPTEPDHSGHDMMKRHGHDMTVTPACRSTSVPFLTTLAYCIHERCFPDPNPKRERLERYWYTASTGDEAVAPMWGWQESYDKVNTTPTATYDTEEMVLNTTMLIKVEEWQAEKQSMEAFEAQERLNSRYCLTLLLVGVGIPILLKSLTHVPYFNALSHWIRPRYVYPTLTAYHVQPYKRIFHPPTLGQSIFILLLSVLTIVFSAVEFNSVQPNTWYATQKQEVLAYVADRTGSLAMPLLPLTILFAGRNNILLWLSNWSHSTYLLVHRWVARLCLIQILLHSILELALHVDIGDYTTELPELYWIWGCVGTVACVIMVIAAQFRKYYYEIFLISHILLAVFVIAGTWYHLEYLFQRQFGYQIWIYLCCAVWFLDRLLRLGRVLKVGMRQAILTAIGSEVVRVDIPGVRWDVVPGQHAYLYLPATRRWAPWENHPFSVIPTSLLSGAKTVSMTTASTPDIEKTEREVSSAPPALISQPVLPTQAGITLFVRRNKGLTASLPSSTLTALLDGPYRNTSSRPVLSTDRLILFAGGIGITGILAFVHAHPNVKIYWSVRAEQADLVKELEGSIPGHVERSILVGGRNDVEVGLAHEVKAGWALVGVVVCGPGGMCDEVRDRVSWLGKNYGTKWELDVEAFLW